MSRAVVLLLLVGTAVCKEEEVTLGMGCFFKAVDKLKESDLSLMSVTRGYSGGFMRSPDYKSVMKGGTGHALCVNIVYDTDKVTLKDVLNFFWSGHDPTNAHRQGKSIGSQFRSLAFFRTPEQNQTIHASLDRHIADTEVERSSIATEIQEFDKFWPVEKDIDSIHEQIDAELRDDMEAYIRQEREKAEQAAEHGNNDDDKALPAELLQREHELRIAARRKEDAASSSDDSSSSSESSATGNNKDGIVDLGKEEHADDDTVEKNEENNEEAKDNSGEDNNISAESGSSE